ncbi:MAG TPA: hypothetical protein VFY36_07445 [Solirubrobacteraceae bacterium]|nr:hypothetical protein [Solirubrobacteraceae bacterium]
MSRTETHTPTRPRRRLSLPLAIAATILLLSVGATSATATSSIEGIWSFNGGQIAVQPAGSGKLVGIVVSPTTFATCTHPVGQEIWTGMTLQSNGSYQGFHQWYFETSACALNPTPGPTAWRVQEEANGSRYLRVCLSAPGGPQPSIPPGSMGTGANYGCQNSALTAPLAKSEVGTFKQVVKLPSARKCLSGRKFQIHVRDTKYDPFKSVIVTLKGHKLKVAHRGSTYTTTVNLKGLTHGAFTIKIKATTVRGHRVSGSRTYHTCAKKHKKSKPKKLR